MFQIHKLLLATAVGLLLAVPCPAGETPGDLVRDSFFERKIRPLLVERCYECHSAQSRKLKGGLRLDSRAGVLQGGDTGAAIVPGAPEQSLLVKAVRSIDPDLQMPPKNPLSPDQIADLETWVKMGAPFPELNRPSTATSHPASAATYWSFQPLRPVTIPSVQNKRWPRNPIDHFILARLERDGLTPAGTADKRTLIRRVAFDLTGLPPSPAEIEKFINDTSSDALARVIDRLLDSPRYGERWGRHWLDVARYADTAGDAGDYPIPQMFLYRDYVIAAFNQDKPYDQFVREQIAGDLLPASNDAQRREQIVATGFLALSRRYGVEPTNSHHLTIEDSIDTLGRSLLGLSLSCARCHDHKYDPVSMRDYYALYGIFNSTRYPYAGSENFKRQRDLVPLVSAAEAETLLRPYREKLAVLDAEFKKLEGDQAAAQQRVVQAVERKVSGAEAIAAGNHLIEVESDLETARERRDEFTSHPPPVVNAFAVAEGLPGNARVQKRGDPLQPGDEVPRGFLEIFGGGCLPADATGSGRRELAGWLTTAARPLLARVMVNRVWQHHFGRGLVPTPSDFGSRGRPPTHPELLDFLAEQFIARGWSLKAMHKFILLSQTYQMSGADDAMNAQLDPANERLWRFPRQRLDAEAMRDAILQISGELDLAAGGPHPFPAEDTWMFTQHHAFTALYDTRQRSVYLMTQRLKRHPFLALFDGADTNVSLAERGTSTTALQALFLMNDPFTHERAAQFARRLQGAAGTDRERINVACQLVFGRAARAGEIREGELYLGKWRGKLRVDDLSDDERTHAALASYARVLFGSNEFMFVE